MQPLDHAAVDLQHALEGVFRLIERGQHTGQIRPEIDAETLSRVLIALFQGLVLQVVWGEPIDREVCGRLVHGLIRDALLTPAALAALNA